MAARNTRIRKLPEKYVPSMKGNKYTVVLTQIVASLKESKDAISTAQMFVKMMNKGVHQNADIVGMVMAQLSLCNRPWYWQERYPNYGTSHYRPDAGVSNDGLVCHHPILRPLKLMMALRSKYVDATCYKYHTNS